MCTAVTKSTDGVTYTTEIYFLVALEPEVQKQDDDGFIFPEASSSALRGCPPAVSAPGLPVSLSICILIPSLHMGANQTGCGVTLTASLQGQGLLPTVTSSV